MLKWLQDLSQVQIRRGGTNAEGSASPINFRSVLRGLPGQDPVTYTVGLEVGHPLAFVSLAIVYESLPIFVSNKMIAAAMLLTRTVGLAATGAFSRTEKITQMARQSILVLVDMALVSRAFMSRRDVEVLCVVVNALLNCGYSSYILSDV